MKPLRWDDEELQAAALRLLLGGALRTSQRLEALLRALDEAGIVRPTPRRDEFVLDVLRKGDLRRYLATRWPAYAEAEALFSGDPDTLDGATLRALRRRHLDLPPDRRRLHHKTWAAWTSAHSKAAGVAAPEGLALTMDSVLRLRPSAGMKLVSEDGAGIELDALAALTGELVLPERSFGRPWNIVGRLPKIVLTVENLGAYVDAPQVDGVLMIHVPGWDSALARQFIERLPAGLPWWHFGDLDPEGLEIGRRLTSGGEPPRRPRLWIPACAVHVLDSHVQRLAQPWPEGAVPPELEAHPVIARLIERQQWLEQEVLVLLPGFAEELSQVAELSK